MAFILILFLSCLQLIKQGGTDIIVQTLADSARPNDNCYSFQRMQESQSNQGSWFHFPDTFHETKQFQSQK